MRTAIVTGVSDDGINLVKRLFMSYISNVLETHSVDFHVYRCNFDIINYRDFNKGLRFLENPPPADSYQYQPTNKIVDWSDIPDWDGKLIEHHCQENFPHFYFPDVAVYHHFAQNHLDGYDYVLYCHNDLEFLHDETSKLNNWIEIVGMESEYSIIAELRAIANYNISVRFHMCFVFVNTDKFHESKLSFINNYHMVDPATYHVYSNGGNGLMASFYRRMSEQKNKETPWRPYLIDVHGVHRGPEISTKDKWFVHYGGIEWNRKKPLGQLSSVQRTKNEYKKAELYVQKFL